MEKPGIKIATICMILALCLGLTGCERKARPDAGQRDRPKTDQSASETKHDASDCVLGDSYILTLRTASRPGHEYVFEWEYKVAGDSLKYFTLYSFDSGQKAIQQREIVNGEYYYRLDDRNKIAAKMKIDDQLSQHIELVVAPDRKYFLSGFEEGELEKIGEEVLEGVSAIKYKAPSRSADKEQIIWFDECGTILKSEVRGVSPDDYLDISRIKLVRNANLKESDFLPPADYETEE